MKISYFLEKRKKNSHKGDFGHILILGGSRGMTGAIVLASNACIRSGAGLVTAGIPLSQQEIVAKKTFSEVMTLPLPETKNKTLSSSAFEKIKKFISERNVSTLALGPGLRVNSSTKKLVEKILRKIKIPVILDADGLNVLKEFFRRKPYLDFNVAITPHPGEMSRISGKSTKEIQKNRKKVATQFSKKFGVICILKGYRTIVSDGEKIFINTTGNPGMAVAGCGDVLTGMFAAFVNQVKGKNIKEKLFNAGVVSVYLHGLAGDIAAKEKTQISLLPSDLIEKIPCAIKRSIN